MNQKLSIPEIECEATCTGSREEPLRSDWIITRVRLLDGQLEEPDDRLWIVSETEDNHEIWTYVREGVGAHVGIFRMPGAELVAHYHGPAAERAHQWACDLLRRLIKES